MCKLVRYTTFLMLAAAGICGAGISHAADESKRIDKMLSAPVNPGSQEEIMRFCANIAEPARERRYALQRAELEKLKAEVEERVRLLEEKRAELEMWAKRREAFAEQAGEGLVKVLGSMRPDAAAERLGKLDVELSAALIMKLKARSAAAILSEMDAERASVVTTIMAASANKEANGT